MRVAFALLIAMVLAAPARAWTVQPLSGTAAFDADGSRYAVLGLYGDDRVSVFDDRTAAWRSLTLPAGCTFHAGVGGGRVALECYDARGFAHEELVDLRGGPTVRPPALDRPGGDRRFEDGVHVAALGSHWAEITTFGNHYADVLYAPLAGRRVRHVDRGDRWADLDAVNVSRPLCAPVRRPASHFMPADGETAPRFEVIRRSGRWFVTFAARQKRVEAWRCGRRHPRTVATCVPYGDCGYRVGAGVVSFLRDGRARVLRLEGFRSSSLALPDAEPGWSVWHTRHFLFAERPGPYGMPGVLAVSPLPG